jgi:hypothetical protein
MSWITVKVVATRKVAAWARAGTGKADPAAMAAEPISSCRREGNATWGARGVRSWSMTLT